MNKDRLLKLAAAFCLFTGCTGNDVTYNRGIGIYPGNPSEDFSPVMKQDDEYRNIALHRAAYASSSYDYNLTAQLITDGIITNEPPKYLTVTTSQGDGERREREWTIDGHKHTKTTIYGDNIYIEYALENGWTEIVDGLTIQAYVSYEEGASDGRHSIKVLGSSDGVSWETLGIIRCKTFPGEMSSPQKHSDPDKASAAGNTLLPTRKFTTDVEFGKAVEVSMLRIEMNMPGAAHWQLRSCDFRHGEEPVNLLASKFFTSAWRSLGCGEEWLYVDLGAVACFDKVILKWLNKAHEGKIQTSSDAVRWKDVAKLPVNGNMTDEINVKGRGRYVRILMSGSADGKPYMLSEIEIYGRGGMKAEAKPSPEATENEIMLSGGSWELCRASETDGNGQNISTKDFNTENWLKATVPGTVLTSHVNVGAIPDPNHAGDLFNISESYFNSDFWYRNKFEIPESFLSGKTYLDFDGINWKAEVYLNGKKAGDIGGAFKRGRFDIGDMAVPGTNVLAVKIIKNANIGAVKEKNEKNTGVNGGMLGLDNPTFHATIGWDWISTVRGRNIGIWNDVRITHEGQVSVSDPFVNITLPLPDTTSAELTPEVMVRNNGTSAVTGLLSGNIGGINFSKEVRLEEGEEKAIRFNPEEYPQLKMKNPRLWWPNGYGQQYLYDAGFTFSIDGRISDKEDFKVGVRQVDADEKNGILTLYVNGRRFVGRGGNWGFSESNLNYRAREYDIAVAYHADMNFTILRNWVGQTGDVELYEACDRYGIMIWQDFWLANPADGPDPADHEMFMANAEDFVRRYRSHPSLVLYCGRNEGFPPEDIDRALREIVREMHPGMHYISSSADGCVSGHGPYNAMTQRFYFENPKGRDRFHSEMGMPSVMTYESMVRTFSPDSLWPQSRQWGQHDFTLEGAQKCATFNQMLEKGYGKTDNAKEYAEAAQFLNYDGYRAMFEGRSSSRRGLLLWMSHPAWPSMTWQTYDWYLEPTASYFGCKKACEPLHIQWNASTDMVEVVNYSAGRQCGLTAKAQVVCTDGNTVWEHECGIDSDEDTTLECFRMHFPAEATETHFVRLTLSKDGKTVSDNFYIRGREEGNHSSLRNMKKADVKTRLTAEKNEDGIWNGMVRLENNGDVPAVYIRINVVGRKDGEQILPMFYEDNYFSLMPKESKEVRLEWSDADTRGNRPEVRISGINL